MGLAVTQLRALRKTRGRCADGVRKKCGSGRVKACESRKGSPLTITSGLQTGGLGGGELSNQPRGNNIIILILNNPKGRRLPEVHWQLMRGVGMIKENCVHLHWHEVSRTINRRGASHLNGRNRGCRQG